MKEKPLNQRIKDYLDIRGCWVNGKEIEKRALEAVRTNCIGYKGSTASRECRKMFENKEIDSKEEGGSVWYRSLTPKTKKVLTTTLPTGEKIIIKTIYE